MSDEKLEEIKSLLDDIKFLLMISNEEKIDEIKNNFFKDGNSIRRKIYDLCDGKTNEEIGKIIGKRPEYVASNISRLRLKGLVKTIEKNDKKIHFQRF